MIIKWHQARIERHEEIHSFECMEEKFNLLCDKK